MAKYHIQSHWQQVLDNIYEEPYKQLRIGDYVKTLTTVRARYIGFGLCIWRSSMDNDVAWSKISLDDKGDPIPAPDGAQWPGLNDDTVYACSYLLQAFSYALRDNITIMAGLAGDDEE